MTNNLLPREVFGIFEQIAAIPHGSFNSDGISSFIEKYALDRGYPCTRDDHNNIIIVKEASPGYEDAPGVIMQSHMDMVCVAEDGYEIDFLKIQDLQRTKNF